jgi:hypothetical protein
MAVNRKANVVGPSTRKLVTNKGRKEQNERVLALMYALQCSSI